MSIDKLPEIIKQQLHYLNNTGIYKDRKYPVKYRNVACIYKNKECIIYGEPIQGETLKDILINADCVVFLGVTIKNRYGHVVSMPLEEDFFSKLNIHN